MIIDKPKIRGFVCTNAHPNGCAKSIENSIEYVEKQGKIDASIKNVLIIGASTGYGLASRVVSSMVCDANTLGIFFEKPPSDNRTASAGYYNSVAIQKAAHDKGLYAESINGDAFSQEIKQQTIDQIKADMGAIDLVVYSLAAPRRTDPKTGEIYQSVLKPIGDNVQAKTLNTSTGEIHQIELEAATEQEIEHTVRVMGGDDWQLWMQALLEAGALNVGCKTVAYTYLGREITWPIYGRATIGRAKEDLDRVVKTINQSLQAISGKAYISVLKGLVTQASSAIPMMPLYIAVLYRVMKDRDVHEGCIEQIYRLFNQSLYSQTPLLDDEGRLRVDDKECSDEVQQAVQDIWQKVSTDNLKDITDFAGYQREFLHLFGFGYNDIDYFADVDHQLNL